MMRFTIRLWYWAASTLVFSLVGGGLRSRRAAFSMRLAVPFVMCALVVAGGSMVTYGQSADWGLARGVLSKYCSDCHEGDTAEAELDMTALDGSRPLEIAGGLEVGAQEFRVVSDVQAWLRIREILESGQMPPPDSPQIPEPEYVSLMNWLNAYLRDGARRAAGDPGFVPLRRLSNFEYTYSIRDLTGVRNLNPAAEFPLDGAAGEGFTNVGSGQAMSPAMVQKYLDAGHKVAQHLVLLPDGIGFSESTSRRDRTNNLIAMIQQFYRRYSAGGGGTAVDLQGVRFETNAGGRLPLRAHLRALASSLQGDRDEALTESGTPHSEINPVYFSTLLHELDSARVGGNPWLHAIRTRLVGPGLDDSEDLSVASEIEAAQEQLWRFNAIGQIGRQGGATQWMEPLSTVVTRQKVQAEYDGGEAVQLRLIAWGDGDCEVRLEQGRFEFLPDQYGRGVPALPLTSLDAVKVAYQDLMFESFSRFGEYLSAVEAYYLTGDSLDGLADRYSISKPVLKDLIDWMGLGAGAVDLVSGRFQTKLSQVGGYADVAGLGDPATPNLLLNPGDEPRTITTLTLPPQSVVVHPSPDRAVYVAWRAPNAGQFRFRAMAQDVDPNCGNGVDAMVRLGHPTGGETLWETVVANGQRVSSDWSRVLDLEQGDVLWLLIGAGQQDHICDSTAIEWELEEVSPDRDHNVKWSIKEFLAGLEPAETWADSSGHPGVWYVGSQPTKPSPGFEVPRESLLGVWRRSLLSRDSTEIRAEYAQRIQSGLVNAGDGDVSLRQLRDPRGPIQWLLHVFSTFPPSKLSMSESRVPLEPNSSKSIELISREGWNLPGRVVCEASVAAGACAVQLDLSTTLSDSGKLNFRIAEPVLTSEAGEESWKLKQSIFRDLFPPRLCYEEIVPVDEVVTLTLFHREDGYLRKLFLTDEECLELDRLWNHLLFVSQEPLQLAVAYEQLVEFATQDRPDLVVAFRPLAGPIAARVDAFKLETKIAEVKQWESLMSWTSSAWRRPLTSDDIGSLRSLYERLVQEELTHEEAMEWVVAKVLSAPAFVYKLEQPAAGDAPAPISDHEFATRLSYFLWASTPDQELLDLANQGLLTDPQVRHAQVSRMLSDDKMRRMAMEFGCQWLHLRDFVSVVEKNESLYPDFNDQRDSMLQEVVLFWDDLIRNNGTVWNLLEADHTFLDATLAEHYGVSSFDHNGPAWQRVEGLRSRGRGGLLGMAAVLSSQSGASRTSPILRGNWIYETLLGRRLPRPPVGVPVLPETPPEGLNERELIELHSSSEGCARCHRKIDPFGFALEQFDTTGQERPEPVVTHSLVDAKYPVEGLSGLRSYLLDKERDAFLRQFCRKLMGYAYGRELQLADEPLLEELMGHMNSQNGELHAAIHWIVESQPFRLVRPRGSHERD